MRAISKGALLGIKRIVSERLENLQDETIEARVTSEISNVMLDVIEVQIDRKLKSRELLEPSE
jgi:hypothetical protein